MMVDINRYGEVPTSPVVMAACDSKYFMKFAPAFLASVVTNTRLDAHVHVINPTEEVLSLACYLQFRCGNRVTYTFSDSDLSNNTEEEKRALYASLRFLVAPYILSHCEEMIIFDIDCLAMKEFKYPEKYDLGYFPREPLEGTVGWEQEGTKVAAGCVYFHKNAMNVCNAVAETLGGLPLKWFNDQIALNHVFSQVPDKICWKYDWTFMDWEFRDSTLVWTGKGPRKYDNPKYVEAQNQYHDLIMNLDEDYSRVILKPRLDIPFKKLSVCVANSVKEPIRNWWGTFCRKKTNAETLIVESPRWMFNNKIEKYFPKAKEILVPHVEQHNFKGGHNTYYYMQTVFPFMFTIDPVGWAGGASYVNDFDPEADYNDQAFVELQKYMQSGSKFQHLQSKTTNWDGIKDNYIVVPLQLPHDETIKWHSDITCEEFVTALCEFADSFSACPQLVFKGHPVNLGAMEPLRKIISKYKNVHYIADGNFHDLVLKADGMWVLNGGSGQEAMLLEKPVACFGRCDYAPAVVQGDIKDMGTMWNKFFPEVASQSIEGNPRWLERLELYKKWYHWYVTKVCFDLRK